METLDNDMDFSDVDSRTAWSSEVDEVDNLSTNQNTPMDRETEEGENEDTSSTGSHDDQPKMSAELETALKILSDLMSDSKKAVNWPFMASVEETAPELYEEYRKRIDKPMWLRMMKEKFDKREYSTITEFVSDFRLMLENCYRFNGPDHYISKRGQKLETMLEQKLALLSRELREKTSIDATSGIKNNINSPGSGMRRRQKNVIPHDSTYLLNQLREQEQQKVREWRKKQLLDRKAEKEALAQEILDWEDSVLFSGKYREHMRAMWEIPQIGLFLFLCQVPLNIGEVMHFELERCFLIPRESSTMQLVMTSLLSTPFQRLRIDKKSLMPYKVWEYKLRMKVQQWYKAYIDNDFDSEKTWLKTGIDEKFFEIVGTKNPLEKKRFHHLTFYKKVWIVKSLCDYCLQTQDSLRETIELQPFADQREYLLGTDGDGKRYIHFPQFCGADVRVYRQAPVKYPKIEIKPDPFDNKRKFPLVYKPPPPKKMKLQDKKKVVKKAEKLATPQPSPSRQRPSRLRQSVKPVIPIQIGGSATSTDGDTSDNSQDESDNHQMEVDETGDCDSIADNSINDDKTDTVLNDGDTHKNDLNDNGEEDEEEDKSLEDNDRLSSASDVTIAYGDNSDNSSISSHDYSRESSPYLSTDVRLRRSSRLEKFSDTSRETSPMIYDSDNGLSRTGSSRSRLRTQTAYKASRNLTSMLIDENSTASNSSAFGEPCMSGILTERLVNNANLNVNSTSSETGEESVDCDIQKMFSNAGPDSNNDSSQSFKDHSREKDSETAKDDSSSREESNLLIDKSMTKSELLVKSKNNSDSVTAKGDSNIITTDSLNEISQSDTAKEEMHALNDKCDLPAKHILNGNLSLGETQKHSCDIASHDEDESKCTSCHQEMSDVGVKNGCLDGAHDNGKTIDIDLLTEGRECSMKSNTGKSPSGVSSISSVDTVPIGDKELNGVDQTSDVIKENSSGIAPVFSDLGSDKDKDSDSIKTAETELIHSEAGVTSSDEKQKAPSDIKCLTTKIKQDPSINDGNGVIKCNSAEQVFSCEEKIKLESTDPVGSAIGQQQMNPAVKDYKISDQLSMKLEPGVKEETDAVKEVKKEESDNIRYPIGEETRLDSEEEEEIEDEIVPDLNEFELLADSVEDLRRLTAQFEEQEPIIIKKGKKEQITRPPPRKKCVVHLHERLQFLLKELEPWEGRLVHATKRARIRIRKEVEDYVEPPEVEDSTWDSTDEDTDSGVSDDNADKLTKDGEDSRDGTDGAAKLRVNSSIGKQSRENGSGASTPVKLEDIDDIDVSQRGRLRKRRIIPNNAEDQIAPKKLKPKAEQTSVTTQDTPTSSQPIIIQQSGKSQLVDYSDILRQLKIVNSKGALPSGVNPVLIKTTQGGRTLLTSVMPLNNKSSASNSTLVPQKLQNIRLISPLALQQQLSGQNVNIPLHSLASSTPGSTKKISQHPTIQNLLTGNATTIPSGLKDLSGVTSMGGSVVQIVSQSVKSDGLMSQLVSQAGQPLESPLLTPVKTIQSGTVLVTPEKMATQDQLTPHKLVINPNTTPRKIAPYPMVGSGATSKGTVKYYAANASTLPINVVQQLLATRGAKLQTGPNHQSILYIPMESDGDTRNVASVTGKYVSSIPLTQAISTVIDSQVKLSTASMAVSSQGNVVSLTKSNKSLGTSNLPILPKPLSVPSTSPVFNMSLPSGMLAVPVPQGTSLSSISPNQASSGGVSKTVKTLFQTRLPTGGISLNPTSPPRYPTNETVRTLLDKRKFVDDKMVGPSNKVSGDGVHMTYTCIASQLQRPCPSTMTSSVILKKFAASAESNASDNAVVGMPLSGLRTATTESAVLSGSSVPQHVITSISPAKLNTLLLQTSAAGAKTIPTMIKLPSKAVLESAVKAVVTSVPTSIPTINMKVPSPTTLPSIGPRRNVTKTVQTMKSPIPVAPKVVTQNSGKTTLSVADSHALLATQSTASSSKMGATTQMSPPSNTTPVKAHLATFVENSDGKKVLKKIPAPVNPVTSESSTQAGYVTPQGYIIPKLQQNMGSQSASAILNQLGLQSQVKQEQMGTGSSCTPGMQLVQNAQGALQLVPKVGMQTQFSTSKGALLQVGHSPNTSLVAAQLAKKGLGTKQLVAINAQGKHIIVKQKFGTTQSQSTDPSIILSKSNTDFISPSPLPTLAAQPQSVNISTGLKPAVINQNTELKSQGTNYILPHTVSGVMNPIQSPAVTQPAFSPLLNMQQVLLPGSGFQLASPVINPVGLNILQSGLQHGLPPQSQTMIQTSQNVNIQTSQSPTAGQPVVNLNQALLDQALLSNIGQQHQLKMSPAVNFSSQASGTTARPVLLPSGTVLNRPKLLKDVQLDLSKDGANTIYQTEDGLHLTVKENPHVKTPDSSVGSIIVSGGGSGALSSSALSLTNPSLSTASSAGQVVLQFAVPPQNIVSPTFKQSFPLAQTATATMGPSPRQLLMNYSLVKAVPQGQNTVQIPQTNDTRTHTIAKVPVIDDQKPVDQIVIPKFSQNAIAANGAMQKQLLMNYSLEKAVSQGTKNVQVLQTNDTRTHTIAKVPGSDDQKAVDQSVTPKHGQSNQKLLLYSIGGQLVTGQGVPVTLHQGVLKVMPQGKLQIANQTLTPEQIKQTLAKIGGSTVPGESIIPHTGPSAIGGLTSAVGLHTGISASGGNPSTSTAHSGLSSFNDTTSAGIILSGFSSAVFTTPSAVGRITSPTQISTNPVTLLENQSKPLPTSQLSKEPAQTLLTDSSSVDHAYQHRKRTGIISARVKRLATPTSVRNDAIGVPSESDPANAAFVSGGGLPSKGQGQRVGTLPDEGVQSEDRPSTQMQSIVNKAPLGVNGTEENSVNDIHGHSAAHSDGRLNSLEDGRSNSLDTDDHDQIGDEDDEGHHLIIDDCSNEKEAALNLLTLANQALGPS